MEEDYINNGWFVLRSTVPAGVAKDAVEWIISPVVDTSWRYKPVIQFRRLAIIRNNPNLQLLN